MAESQSFTARVIAKPQYGQYHAHPIDNWNLLPLELRELVMRYLSDRIGPDCLRRSEFSRGHRVDKAELSEREPFLMEVDIADYLLIFTLQMPEMGIDSLEFQLKVNFPQWRVVGDVDMPWFGRHPEKMIQTPLTSAIATAAKAGMATTETVYELTYDKTTDCWFWDLQAELGEGPLFRVRADTGALAILDNPWSLDHNG